MIFFKTLFSCLIFVMEMQFFEGLLLIRTFSRKISISTTDQLLIHVLQSLHLQSAMREQGSSFYLKQTQCRNTVFYTSSSKLFVRLPFICRENDGFFLQKACTLLFGYMEAPLSAILKTIIFCRQQVQYSNEMLDEEIVFMILTLKSVRVFLGGYQGVLEGCYRQLTGPNLKIPSYDFSLIGIPLQNIVIIKLLSNISTGLVGIG